jgi:uncharacterized damage-inducible protein DinB
MNVRDLQLLIDYHYWARDRLLDALEPLTPEQFTRDMGNSFRSIRDTAAHIYAAEWAWYSRWIGHSPTALLPADMFPDLATLRQIWSEHESKVRAFFSPRDEDGINQVIGYTLLSGHTGASVLWQMAQHVVNHATYHRGQVVTMLRQLGAAPPKPMDLIAFYRLTDKPSRSG